MKLGTKLVTSFLGCGLIPLGAVAIIGYTTADRGMNTVEQKGSTDLEQKAYNQLVALRDVKKRQIEQYFAERKGDMGVLVENVKALRTNAFEKLDTVQSLKKRQVEALLADMKRDVSALTGSPEFRESYKDFKRYHDEMETPADGPYDVSTDEYQEIYDRWYDVFARYVKDLGYYDVFSISAAHGHVMFTEARESDLGANLSQGKLKDEPLGHLWHRVVETKEVVFEDFMPYSPSNGDQAAFMGAPVFDDAGNLVAVAALQLPTGPINRIVQNRAGLGKTGETYLVGRDEGRTAFRSDMLTMGDGKYVVGYEIRTEYIDRVLSSGRPVRDVFIDSQGNPVMVAADPLDVPGLDWACITKIDLEEAVVLKAEGEKEDFLARYNNLYGYYDLFLFNAEGYCFYSVCHEADYHTNLVSGRFKDSNLGGLVREVLQSGTFGFADIAPYAPSDGAPASFIAQSVAFNGKTELVVALQLPLETVNGIMGVRAGMGETGETYLVGPDKLMRSDSFLDPADHSVVASFKNPSKGSVDTEAAVAALAGETGARIISDYNGSRVLSAFAPLDVFGTRWALLAEIDESEAMAAAQDMQQTATAAETRLLTWIGSLGAGAAVLVTVVSLLISRSINRPITRIITGLNEGADQVNDAAGQVSNASQQLAAGASEQASSLEETSSALEQLAAMTRTNADTAREANDLSDQARTAAQNGDQTMAQLNEAMGAINTSADQISKIIKVIEEIAFQTNLLALNAAVEAARAGEHGKGFAVVADEVRNLAQRAAQASGEITGLIEGSVTKAREGTGVAAEVGNVLTTIVGDVTKVADLIAGITKASEEQAMGVEQINGAVSQMDKVTQQNASGAEESASAAEQLSAQAQNVKGVVGQLVALVEGTTSGGQGFGGRSAAATASSSARRGADGGAPTAAGAGGRAKESFFVDDGAEVNEF